MKKTDLKTAKFIYRVAASLAAALVFAVSLPLYPLADTVTDAPSLPGGSGTGGTVIIAPPGSGENSGTGGNSGNNGNNGNTVIITDEPFPGGNAGTDETKAADNGNSVPTEAPGAGSADNGTASAPEAKTSDTEFGKAPETAASTETQAPAAAVAAAAAAAAETVSGPSSTADTSGAGSVYANSAVTRINLDFSLITPNHTKGVLKVARGSVKLANGSWQNFDYDDNIHYAFYRLKDTQTDSLGNKWYIATVKARRFGDTYAEDGELKTELWLDSSDCIVRSTLDISTTSPKRIAIVKAALSTLGKQYIYGGNGPDAYDCSGLVQYVCKQAGISVPRTSTQLLNLDGQISAAELRPGDIMVRAGHCGIYIGNGIFVHASDSSVGVVAEYLSVYNLSNKFTNYVNVVGD